MTTRRILLAATALVALAACDRGATTEPLRPNAPAFQRGADDVKPRQEPQPGDDKGGISGTSGTRGGKGRGGADDPANHR